MSDIATRARLAPSVSQFSTDWYSVQEVGITSLAKTGSQTCAQWHHALLRQGRSEVGPYQSPMEDGMQHFHEFYRRTMAEALATR